MTKLNEEDLEDIGIVKLGHQKKILLAIKRVKDVLNGKVVPCINFCCQPSSSMGVQPTIAIGPMYQQQQQQQQPQDEQFTHLPSKATFYDPRMLPEHHQAQNYNPQAIQTHYQQHPAMAHAMVSFNIIFI
jgi:hypothetical protein